MNVHDASISIHLHHCEEKIIARFWSTRFTISVVSSWILPQPSKETEQMVERPWDRKKRKSSNAYSNLSNHRRMCFPNSSTCLNSFQRQSNEFVMLELPSNFQGEEVFQSRPGSRTPRVSCRSALKKVPRPISIENFCPWPQSATSAHCLHTEKYV